jgi:hypothetical protein
LGKFLDFFLYCKFTKKKKFGLKIVKISITKEWKKKKHCFTWPKYIKPPTITILFWSRWA